MMTLQDVLDAVGTTPERYGSLNWYKNGKPWCPIAVEVLGDAGAAIDPEIGAKQHAANLLGCSANDIAYFVNWWDMGDPGYRGLLESAGYRVPPDSVRERSKRAMRIKENTP